MDTIEVQLQKAKDELAKLKPELDKAKTDLSTVTAERDELKKTNGTLTTERDSARSERDELNKSVDTKVSQRLADHCSKLGIPVPKSGVKDDKPDVPGQTKELKDDPNLKGRDRVKAGIRQQLISQGLTNGLHDYKRN